MCIYNCVNIYLHCKAPQSPIIRLKKLSGSIATLDEDDDCTDFVDLILEWGDAKLDICPPDAHRIGRGADVEGHCVNVQALAGLGLVFDTLRYF